MQAGTGKKVVWARAMCALAGWVLASSAQAVSASYTGVYVFGDSLADSGNVYAATGGAVPLSPPYYSGGRFSNGPNFADVLAANLGLGQFPYNGLNPSLVPGANPFPWGTNYAWGGANSGPAVLPVGGLSVPSVYRATLPGPNENPSQLQLFGAYLQGANRLADSSALYVVWTGGGDLRDAVNYAQTHNATALVDGEAVVSAAIGNIHGALTQLQAMGAQHVLVPNVPDIGLTPETRDWAAHSVSWLPAYASALTGNFNVRLRDMLTSFQGLDIIQFDTYGLFNQINATPAAFGLSNTTDPCLTTGALSIYVGGTVCASPGTLLYWDNHHPTAVVHELLGDRMFAAVVPEPQIWGLMLAGLAGITAVASRRRA